LNGTVSGISVALAKVRAIRGDTPMRFEQRFLPTVKSVEKPVAEQKSDGWRQHHEIVVEILRR
jgi:hypothetical protein